MALRDVPLNKLQCIDLLPCAQMFAHGTSLAHPPCPSAGSSAGVRVTFRRGRLLFVASVV